MTRALPIAALVAMLVACQAAPGEGALCTRAADCTAPLVCARARCRNECARSSDCPALARCLVDPTTGVGSCSLDVDSCREHACPVGFLCRDDECLNACGSIVGCPDGVCVDGACVTVRGDAGIASDAAVVPDAGPSSSERVVAIAGGVRSFCAITEPSELWCWGASSHAEAGDRQISHGDCAACAPRPVRALDASGHPLTGVTAVAMNDGFVCAVVEGNVLCWGVGPLGTLALSAIDPQLVLASSGASPAPLTGATQVQVGLTHACALASGEIWCWGNNPDGRLGDGTMTASRYAIRATELPSMPAMLWANQEHTLALTADGRILGVGNNDDMALGAPTPTVALTAARATAPSARSLYGRYRHVCALLVDGTLACWGGVSGFLASATPLACPIGSCIAAPNIYAPPPGEVLAGVFMSDDEAGVWTESGNVYGVVGSSLVAAGGPTDVIGGAGSRAAACLLTRAGEVWCAGDNVDGQLGRGTHDDGTFVAPERVILAP